MPSQDIDQENACTETRPAIEAALLTGRSRLVITNGCQNSNI